MEEPYPYGSEEDDESRIRPSAEREEWAGAVSDSARLALRDAMRDVPRYRGADVAFYNVI